jgi:hypothetical protein
MSELSPQNSMGAILQCLKDSHASSQALMAELQTQNSVLRQENERLAREISSLPTAQSDVSELNLEALAAVLADNHKDALRGERGEPGKPGAVTSMPSGAIVAFASSESNPCPGEDWKIYDDAKGRFIVGAGHSRFNDLTPRLPGDVGGSETHVLTVDEMPAHTHGVKRQTDGNSTGADAFLARGHTANIPPSNTASLGRGFPHNNMPPFIALYFCIKE